MIQQVWSCDNPTCDREVLVEAPIRPTLSQIDLRCACKGFHRFKFKRSL